ncbi:hypothetical protein EPI10_029300 [Gossypium australe]|uniref:Uncharacterized protein n=1 Tax=Gossypium australe TaxID=47621 RepID=A0A5B6V181_9ROSI|nr:hypothetical protein EPI10_029300 [Gossypium australe]
MVLLKEHCQPSIKMVAKIRRMVRNFELQMVKLLQTTVIAKVEARRENFLHVIIMVEKGHPHFNKIPQQVVEAHISNQEKKDQLFVATCF